MFYQTSKEELLPIFVKLFKKIEKVGRNFQNHFMKPLPWSQNQTRMPQEKKLQTLFLLNIDVKILKKY